MSNTESLNKLDKQLAEDGKAVCSCIAYGILTQNQYDNLINTSVRRTVNSFEGEAECEMVELPIAVNNPACPPSLVLQPEYEFEIGNPVDDTEIIYGYYWFETGNTNDPIAVDLANDIAQYGPLQPDPHYSSDQWVPTGVSARISSPYICYHVIRLPIVLTTAQIIDEAGVKVNADWTVLSDTQYTYYLRKQVIAPSDVTYNVKE